MASPCRLDISQIKKYTHNVPCKLLKCTHKCLHRPPLVCAFFPVGVTCRSTRLSSMTEPSIPVWPATLQAKPHVISAWLCMVRFQRLTLLHFFNYSCRWSHYLSTKNKLQPLIVPVFSVAPSIREGSQTVSAPINESAVLECIVNGVPPPQVTWRKQGAILVGNNSR